MESARILLNPDPLGLGGGGAPDPSPPPAEEPRGSELQGSQVDTGRADLFNERSDTSTQGSTVAPAGGTQGGTNSALRAPADPNQAAGATAAESPQWQSIREAAGAYGLDLSRYADDRQALQALVHQAQANRQADYYAQLGRQLAPQATQIQQYLQQQKAPAAPQRNPWEPPPFDERWSALVTRDEQTGVFVAKPGVDPQVAKQVNDYVEWNSQFQRNPAQYIQPLVETRAKEIAQQAIREHFTQYQQQATIASISDENSPWLYQVDANGRRQLDFQGRPSLSPLGARYITHLQTLSQSGVRDPRIQDTLAKQLIRGEVAALQAQQAQQAAAANNPQTQAALGRPPVNPLQAQPVQQRRANPAATDPSTAGKSLAQILSEEFRAGGVTDNDFAFAS